MIIVPMQTHPVWKNLVEGKVKKEFKFLAANILMMRIRSNIEQNPSPENIEKYAVELRELFNKNSHLPMVQDDIKLLSL